MTPHNRDQLRTAYTISVDARDGVTTGISAADRAHTVRVLVDSATEPCEIIQPGHVFPLRYREGGVLVRRGHTEAAVDLARLAGLTPAGVLAEIVNDDGTMKRGQQLREFADEHGLALISIEDLVRYRRRHEVQVERVAETRLPTRHGDFTAYGYRITVDDGEHIALVHGDVSGRRAGARPGALRVPDRRRVRLPPVRLRSAAGRGARADRRGGPRRRRLPARARGPRASGWSPSCRPTRCRTAAATPSTPTSTSGCRPTPATTARRADPARPRRRQRAAAHQQPGQGDQPGGLRHAGGRAGAADAAPERPQPGLPADQARPDGPRPPRPGRQHGDERQRTDERRAL